MALGLHAAGFEHIGLVEFESKACETLRHNANLWESRNGSIPPWTAESVRLLDVRDLRVGDILRSHPTLDLVAGGPPCQPFSLGGVHAGMADERNMFPAAIGVVREILPSLVLFENVPGLLRKSFTPYFEYVELQLRNPTCRPRRSETWQEHRDRLLRPRRGRAATRYLVTRQISNAADFGVPQVRKRVFLMAVRADLTETPLPPVPGTHSEAALLHAQWVSGIYWERHGMLAPAAAPEKVAVLVRSLSSPGDREAEPWRTVRDALQGLPEPVDGREFSGIRNHVGTPGARPYPGHTGSAIDWPSKTMKAGVHGVCGGEAMIRYPDGRLRYMTVREAARVQTFPDDYEFIGARSHAMRHIGNAVAVDVAAAVGRHMLNHLCGQNRDCY